MIKSRIPAALALAVTLLCASCSGNEAYAHVRRNVHIMPLIYQAENGRAGNKMSGLQPFFAARLEALLHALPGTTITSGYRSPGEQAALYARARYRYGRAAGRMVAPPGHSMHGLGLAADLHFQEPGMRVAAHLAAARFGLVFPMGWEPWHVEPIGGRADIGWASLKIPVLTFEGSKRKTLMFAYAGAVPSVASVAAAVPWPIRGHVVHLVSLRHHHGHHHHRWHRHHWRRG